MRKISGKFGAFKLYTSSGFRKEVTRTGVPVGTIIAYATATAPTGWLLCNGSEVSVNSYPELDAVLGPQFGRTNGSGGSGSTHFRLPDLKGRAPIGAGTGSGLTARTLGATGGAETHTLTGAESGFGQHNHPISESDHGTSGGQHSLSSASHSHAVEYGFVFSSGTGTNLNQVGGGNGGYFSGGPVNSNQSWSVSTNTADLKDANGVANRTNSRELSASSAHSNLQPFVVVSYIVKT